MNKMSAMAANRTSQRQTGMQLREMKPQPAWELLFELRGLLEAVMDVGDLLESGGGEKPDGRLIAPLRRGPAGMWKPAGGGG